jgi:hypothetical protein
VAYNYFACFGFNQKLNPYQKWALNLPKIKNICRFVADVLNEL